MENERTTGELTIQNDLPNEIIYLIFSYFQQPKDLCIVASVCSKFKIVAAGSDRLWKKLCEKRWKGKRGMPLEVSYRADYTELHQLLTMKEIKIKNILTKRGIYFKGLLERSEFVQLLLKTTPTPYYGKWSPKWKAAYVIGEMDSKRTIITKDELCSSKWEFRFKQWPDDHPGGASAQFNPDYTYESNLFENRMKWRFYAGQIQVESYPPLTCTRTKNWEWEIENGFVKYKQL